MNAQDELRRPRKRLGGASAGYLLLALTAVFLVNTLVGAFQAQVFDEVVAAVVGIAAAYCLIGVILIAAFARLHSRKAAAAHGASDLGASAMRLVTE